MDTPENYYSVLGVPVDADSDTIKRAYRQLARRYHPDLAGPEGATQMKRINRAYDVLSDPQKRLNYDTITVGVIDLRKSGLVRPRSTPHKFDLSDDIEFSGLSIFSTRGPLHTGPVLHTELGVISALSSVPTSEGIYVAAGSLDGKGLIWRMGNESKETPTSFAADPTFAIESLRELRFSTTGALLTGWGRLGLHVWDTRDGSLLWSYSLAERAVSAHYSLDLVLRETTGGQDELKMALPLLPEDSLAPRAWGVRGSDVVGYTLGTPGDALGEPIICREDAMEKRQFWAIRLRALAQNASTLLTLSCAQVPDEQDEMIVVRRWDLTPQRHRARFGGKSRPQITSSVLVCLCADCDPPYAVTPDAGALAFVYARKMVRLYDTINGAYSELSSGAMGGSAKLALSPDAQWVAVAREDSEINEGVIDLWSVGEARIVQKLYHPWQVSALHFAAQGVTVALTDGTIQFWE